jgi:hypothetical protein
LTSELSSSRLTTIIEGGKIKDDMFYRRNFFSQPTAAFYYGDSFVALCMKRCTQWVIN